MNQQFKGKESVNKNSIIMFTILAAWIIVADLNQFMAGKKSAGLAFGLVLFLVVLVSALWILYKKDRSSDLIRHVMASGYGIFYIIYVFTASQRLVFAYGIPILLVLGMYNDLKFSVMVTGLCSGIAVIHAIWFTSKTGWAEGETEAMTIQIVIMLMFMAFSTLANRVIKRSNDEKVKEVNETGEKTQKMLSDVMSISQDMIGQVNEISSKMEMLSSSSEETLNAMMEVQTGTTDTANSIQNQLYKTEEIQSQIDKVTGAANGIGDNVVVTVDACHEGRDNMKILMEQVTVSEKAGTEVMDEVTELKDITAQMESIVELINNVASQTSLLALNASIEAARAGEAGRGFAVVATEISNLANQTQTATGNISELIGNISSKMNQVVGAINSLIESNKNQNIAATTAEESFEKIIESIREIRTNSNELTSVVSTLSSANAEIVEGIQTISAITEEVSAHSSTTCDASQNNRHVVDEVLSVVEEMTDNAGKLQSLQ